MKILKQKQLHAFIVDYKYLFNILMVFEPGFRKQQNENFLKIKSEAGNPRRFKP